MIVPSLMFLCNFLKSLVLCKENVNMTQFSPLNPWNHKYTDLCILQKVENKKRWCFACVICCTSCSFFNQTNVLFLHVCDVLGVCRGMHFMTLQVCYNDNLFMKQKSDLPAYLFTYSLFIVTGPFRWGMWSHAHVPTHVQNFRRVINRMCKWNFCLDVFMT